MRKKSGLTKGYACKRNMPVSDMLVSGMQCIKILSRVVARAIIQAPTPSIFPRSIIKGRKRSVP